MKKKRYNKKTKLWTVFELSEDGKSETVLGENLRYIDACKLQRNVPQND